MLPKPYYDEDGITIYNADCRDILPHLPKVDLVLTDPPYGYNYASSHTCETTKASWMEKTIANDDTEAARNDALKYFGENWAVFGNLKTTTPEKTKATVIWDKGPASGMGDLSFPFKPSFEVIYLSGSLWKGSRDEGVIKGHTIVTRASMGRVHPNEKPVTLITYLLSKCPDAQTILDPFMGSGTTLVAAKNLGKKAIGIEISEEYCKIAVERLAQKNLFTEVTP